MKLEEDILKISEFFAIVQIKERVGLLNCEEFHRTYDDCEVFITVKKREKEDKCKKSDTCDVPFAGEKLKCE